MNYTELIEKNLNEEDTQVLKSIYAPTVVAVPPADATSSMCVTTDGEIRMFGLANRKHPDDPGTNVYMSSKNAGLSWETHIMKDQRAIGSAGYNPKTGRYMSIYPNGFRRDLLETFGKKGAWVIINNEGYESSNSRYVKISDERIHMLKQPMYLESCDRWLVLGQFREFDNLNTVIFISDDDGETWSQSVVKVAPRFEMKPPHKGERWYQGSLEPTIAELDDGSLLMIVRTSQDYHYKYYSYDKGTTWTDPEQTDFHGTNTMPVLYKLTDGRLLFFWCNTQPMPELDHEKTYPPVDETVKTGIWEDVFTNRDANHLAISEDDGKTWVGIRELYLNQIRNNADFRSIGGLETRDKSIHQAQMLELPFNKLLISFGQNRSSRKTVILDIDWLYEKERYEDFRYGLENVSTQMYVHSNLGVFRGFSGHCAYNRTNGALLMPDPDANYEEALQICYLDDDRLVYKKQGAVWNYPASKSGRVEVRLRVVGNGVSLCLTDHWYNPSDEVIKDEAHVRFDYCDKNTDGWDVIAFEYDLSEKKVKVFVNDVLTKEMAITTEAPLGLSYLHIQTLANERDLDGTYIKSMKKY